MVWRIGWQIGGKIGQSYAILKNRMESGGLWHVKPASHFPILKSLMRSIRSSLTCALSLPDFPSDPSNHQIICQWDAGFRLDRMDRIQLFISMHYGINMTIIVSDQSGSGNEKSNEILANMNRIRLRPSIPLPSHSLKSGNGTPALRDERAGVVQR